jgi:hypothetical protein
MVHLALTGKRLTFRQRLISNALWWGIPMVAAELIGVPIRYWVWVVVFALPVTALGVLVSTALEHGFFTTLRNRKHQEKPD